METGVFFVRNCAQNVQKKAKLRNFLSHNNFLQIA